MMMDKKFRKNLSFIGSAAIILIFWVLAINDFISDNVFISSNSNPRMGGGMSVSGYTPFSWALPMTILWIFAFYRVYLKNDVQTEEETIAQQDHQEKMIKVKRNKRKKNYDKNN